jgi:bifunctional DNA-binding transcriptional regulator/antitoxin component of YhaV-PrlF toxin-antitoxin module
MTRTKRLSMKRGLTIPKDIAAEFGITGGETVTITYGCGTITIRKRYPKCRFCGDIEQAVSFAGIDVCPVCADKIKEAVNSG